MNYGQGMVLQKHNAYNTSHGTTEMPHGLILLIRFEVKVQVWSVCFQVNSSESWTSKQGWKLWYLIKQTPPSISSLLPSLATFLGTDKISLFSTHRCSSLCWEHHCSAFLCFLWGYLPFLYEFIATLAGKVLLLSLELEPQIISGFGQGSNSSVDKRFFQGIWLRGRGPSRLCFLLT